MSLTPRSCMKSMPARANRKKLNCVEQCERRALRDRLRGPIANALSKFGFGNLSQLANPVTVWSGLKGRAVLSHQWRWIVCLVLFATLCTAELYVVQAMTLAPDYEGGVRFATWASKIRLMLDLLWVGAGSLLLGRIGLAVISGAAMVLYLILITYERYFLRPLSLLTVADSWREGLSLSEFALDMIDGGVLAVLTLLLVVKLLVLAAAGPIKARLRTRTAIAGVLTLGYCALFLVANYFDPLDRIVSKRGLGRLGIIRGYTGPWLAELYYVGDDRLLAAAIERRTIKDDRLTPYEVSIPIGERLVILQAETLDFSILHHRENGREVTPFLNRLRNEAMFYRILSFHYNGSKDADSTILAGVRASPTTNIYTLPRYPFEDTLPQFLKAHDYRTVALHGNYGAFYNRDVAFRKMGFDDVYFRERLERDFALPADRIGIRDADVLSTSLRLLRESSGSVCQFIITLTSHTPYTFLGARAGDIYPHPANAAERYFNSMHYLDECLRDYVLALPKHTTLMIYGDHGTEVESLNFKADRQGSREFVPCFIYNTDHNLGAIQSTRNRPISLDGTLNLLDLATYLRHQVKESRFPENAKAKDRGETIPPIDVALPDDTAVSPRETVSGKHDADQ